MKSLSKTKAETFETISDLKAIRNNNGPQVILHFFECSVSFNWYTKKSDKTALKLVLGVTEIKFHNA